MEIMNLNSNTIISGSSGDDSITSRGSMVTIEAGAGDNVINIKTQSSDTIKATKINAGDGNDFVSLNAYGYKSGYDYYTSTITDVTIEAGEGDNTVIADRYYYSSSYQSKIDKMMVTTGDGNDAINLSSTNVKIKAGGGNNSVVSDGATLSIEVGAGDDYINASGNYETINADAGDNTIYSSGSNAKITAKEGADSITSYGSTVTIDAGDGDNYIYSSGDNVTMKVGAGNDSITNLSSNNSALSIEAGAGDNVINIKAQSSDTIKTAKINAGEGNDFISLNAYGYKSGYDYYTSTITDVTIEAGVGDNTVIADRYYYSSSYQSKIDKMMVTTGDGNDAINLSSTNVKIKAGGGNNSVVSDGATLSIEVGAGDDYINASGNYETINADAGDNTIYSSGSNAKITAKEGADSITSYGSTVTIDAGDGDNYIYSSGDNVTMKVGAGNDSITNLSSNNSALSIEAGAGDNVINVKAQSSDTIKTAKINAGEGNDFISLNAYGYKSGYDYYTSTITDVTIDAGAGDNTVIADRYYYSSSYQSKIERMSVTTGDGNDAINLSSTNVKIKAGGGNNSVVSDGATLSIEVGAGDDYINASGNYETINADAGDNTIYSSGSNVNITTKEGADYINSTGSTVTIDAGDDTVADTIYSSGSSVSIYAGGGDNSIYSSGDNVTMKVGDGNDSITNLSSNNSALSIEAGAGDNVINVKAQSSDTIKTAKINAGDGNDFISLNAYGYKSGYDYYTSTITDVTIEAGAGDNTVIADRYYYSSSYQSKIDKMMVTTGDGNDAINLSSTNVKIKAGGGNNSVVSDGATLSIEVGAGDDYINASGNYETINADAGDNTIYSSGSNANITTKEGADYINSTGSTVTIDAGDDTIADTIYSSGSSVSIYAGDGDNYIYSSGDNVTVKVDAGNDSITNLSSNNSALSIEAGAGDNVINVKAQSSDTIKTAKINAGAGNDFISLNAYGYKSGYDYYTSTITDVTIDAGAGDNIVIADRYYYSSSYQSKIDKMSVTTGDGNDLISITADNFTIDSGDGNDTISATGSGTYLYALVNGDDVITNYSSDDTIRITDGSAYSTLNDGSDVIVKIGNGSIRLKNYSSIVNIGGGTYQEQVVGVSLSNSTSNILVSGTNGDDSIYNRGENVTINGGKGNDYISVYDSNAIEYASGDGFDTLIGYNASDTIRITDGSSYSTLKNGSDVIVLIGSGSILLKNYSSTVNIVGAPEPVNPTVETPEFDNTVSNGADNVKISGTNGNDLIINSGEHVTVQAAEGNDFIEGSDRYGEVFMFSSADGNDTISNFSLHDSIRISAGSIQSIAAVDNNLIITVKGTKYDGIITLLNTAAERVSVNGSLITYVGEGEDIINHANDTVITGTDYDDYILTDGARVTVEGKRGDDLIENDGAEELFVFSAADGNDTITNFSADDSIKIKSGTVQSITPRGADHIIAVRDGTVEGMILLQNTDGYDFVISADKKLLTVDHINYIPNGNDNYKVSGTSGKDFITNTGSNVSIEPGAGNDTITGSDEYGELYLLSSAFGDNIITNFGANDTIRMTSGKTMTFATVGADVIVTLKGNAFTGVETLLGAAGMNFETVKENNLWHLIVDDINTIVNTNNNSLVSGTNGKDWIENSGSGVTINPGAGDDTIEGSDAYGEMFYLSSAYGDNVITNFGANDTIYMASGKTMSFATVGSDVVVTLKGTSYTGIETLLGAAGMNFVKSADGKYLCVNDIPTLTNAANNVKFTGTSKAEWMINSGSKVTIDGKGGNDTVEAANEAELFFISSGYGNENVILDFGKNDSLSMTGGTLMTGEAIGDDYVISLKGNTYSGKVTLIGAGNMNFVKSTNGKLMYVEDGPETLENYADGVKFAGTSSGEWLINYGERVTIEAKEGNDTIEGSEDNAELINLSSGEGNNVILNFGKNDTIQMTAGKTMTFATVGADVIVTLKGTSYTGVETLVGAAGLNFIKSANGKILYVDAEPDPIYNGTDYVKVNGTDNKDYIINTGQGVSIAAGAGNDSIEGSDFYGEMFMVSSADGHDTITNFGANDTIYMSAGNNMTWATVGADVIVTLKGTKYTGTMTLKDAAGMNFVKSSNGKYLVVDSGINYITNGKDNVKVNGSDGVDWIENAGDNVSIEAKGGNDTIVGSTFDELFLFSGADGNNRVINFGVDDTLKCTSGSIDRVEKSGNDAIVRLKDGNLLSTITLEGAGQYEFEQTEKVLTVKHVNKIINRLDKRNVEGTSGTDDIINYGSNVTLEGGAGDDTLTGSDEYGEVFALSSAFGNNVITNFGYNDTLKMTAGKTLSFATVGADVVVTLKGNTYTGVETLLGAAGMNFKKVGSNTLVVDGITKKLYTKDNTLVGGTEGRDYITSTGSGVTIQGSAGNDTVEGSDEYGEVFQWSSAYDDDVIVNFHSNDTIYMASGKTLSFATVGSDVVVTLKGTSYTGTVTLKDAAGLEFKKSSNGKYLTAAGVSTIVNYANNAKAVGTDGNDYILNTASGVSIQSGAGDDTIEGSNFAETYLFSSAEGNNVVTNFGMNDTLRMTAGKTLTGAVVGDDYVVTLKGNAYTGTVTLQGAGGYNFKKSGSNTLYVDVANKILNTADGVKVNGTGGNDYITNIGQNVTVEAKGGNDTLEGSDLYGELFNFSSGDGNNVILNFGANDTLQMTAGLQMTGAIDGDDYVVTLKGKSYTGTVTLKDAGAESFRISTDGKTLRMKNTISNGGSSAMMPAPEDYWFLDEESAADEIDAIMSADNLIALDEPTVLPTLDGSARSDQLLALDARHQNN